ncbi:MAG: carbamate kinase [Acidilobaceae archaeon]
MLAVVALGGNALLPPGSRGNPEDQWRAVTNTSKSLSDIIALGYDIVITHGNGPQVGYLMESFEYLPIDYPRQTLDLAVAMTQAWIGFMIAHSLEKEIVSRGLRRRVAVVPTRVLVSRDDPEFLNPTKPIGRIYTDIEAKLLAKQHKWVFREDPRGGYRRVVPSPRPVKILEVDIIRALLSQNTIPIAVGGGGIPVILEDGELKSIEAVIDKDSASSLLALELGADILVILTDVPAIALNYGKPNQQWLRKVKVEQLKRYYEQGHFPPGSMGPKVLAAINFTEKSGNKTVIGHLEEAIRVLRGESGTIVEV